MSRISTHVLDTTCGRPAQHVRVRLERRMPDGVWQELQTAHTDGDGRCVQLLPESEILSVGHYRLIFDTGSYYSSLQIDGLYPTIEIQFQAREGESHFHIPLLLSPNGYTTYRGS